MSILQEHKQNLFDFSRSNPMINLDYKKVSVGQLNEERHFEPEDSSINSKIIKKGTQNLKSYGINTLLFTSQLLKWNEGQYEYLSPIKFYELELQKVKGSSQPNAVVSREVFINELLEYRLKTLFNISINDLEFKAFVDQNKFELIDVNVIANFDYKRFILLKDYDQLNQSELSPVLQKIVSGDNVSFTEKKSDFAPIFPLDVSQANCLNSMLDGSSLVIQGPPGTGKSRTISNLIGQNLYNLNSTLFVAEKRVALEVVQKLLINANIGSLCSVVHDSERDKKRFISELSESWDQINQTLESQRPTYYNFDRISNRLNLLNKKIIGTNVSYQSIVDRLIGKELAQTEINVDKFFIEEWIEHEEKYKNAFEQLNLFGEQSFSDTPLSRINYKIFQLNNPEGKIHLYLNEIEKTILELDKIGLSDEFDSIHQLVKASSLARILLSINNIEYSNLLKPTYRKKLYKLHKEHAEITNQLRQNEGFLNQWKNPWTIQELNHAVEILKDKSIKSVLSNKKLVSRFKSDFLQKNIELPIEDCLIETRKLIQLKHELNKIEIDLKVEYGVQNMEQDISYLKQLFHQIDTSSKEIINAFKKEKFKKSYLLKLDQCHQQIQNLGHYTSTLFSFDVHNLKELANHCAQLSNYTRLTSLISFAQDISYDLSKKSYQTLVSLHGSYEEVDYNICKHAHEIYIKKDLNYNRITEDDLKSTFEAQMSIEQEFCSYNISKILEDRKKQFNYFNDLLNTPAHKLNSDQKALKKSLRSGKSLLIKEFTKSRQHKSIRYLYESDAKHWIRVLKPVLLLSPISVSEIFPLDYTFDTIIFDEASQIPIEDSIPSLQRTGQVIVTGDSKQMAPSSLFRSSIEERYSLLGFIKYEYKNIMLNFHYRSNHEDLIKWSNDSFYQGKINTVTHKNFVGCIPLQYYQLENNDYEKGGNISEASFILNYIEKNRNDLRNKSCLIVSLSEVQTKIIRQKLSESLMSRSLNLEVTSLEKLQGEESDIVLISLTHGKDKSGNFSLNFGPINQSNGPNRINVLASRSKEKMVVFSSFDPSLLVSDNSGIKYLASFLNFIQQKHNKVSCDEVSNSSIFNDIHLSELDKELLYSKFKQEKYSGWNPTFRLGKDHV